MLSTHQIYFIFQTEDGTTPLEFLGTAVIEPDGTKLNIYTSLLVPDGGTGKVQIHPSKDFYMPISHQQAIRDTLNSDRFFSSLSVQTLISANPVTPSYP